jgi:fibronectin type 3 domain-containing protein
VAAGEFTLPVEFGREFCVGVQAVQVSGPVSVEGMMSDRVCTTPVDRYPPPVPGGLRVVQEGTVVTLIWDAVTASDLAGYVVLRGDGVDSALVPLVSEPLTATTYRDTTAVAGATYSYGVYSVDTSPAANVSALSTRETITVR